MRTTFIIAVLLFSGQKIHAQKENVFGALLGFNGSNLSAYNGKTSMTLSGGIYWEWKFSRSLSFQSNFLYVKKGEGENKSTPELGLDYINLPIMLKYYVTNQFQVMAGIYYDPLIGIDGDAYLQDDFKDSDFGIPIGISYDLSQNFQLGLSYNFGLTNVFDTNILKSKNHWGALTIAVLVR